MTFVCMVTNILTSQVLQAQWQQAPPASPALWHCQNTHQSPVTPATHPPHTRCRNLGLLLDNTKELRKYLEDGNRVIDGVNALRGASCKPASFTPPEVNDAEIVGECGCVGGCGEVWVCVWGGGGMLCGDVCRVPVFRPQRSMMLRLWVRPGRMACMVRGHTHMHMAGGSGWTPPAAG
jgi:hypothetical protein